MPRRTNRDNAENADDSEEGYPDQLRVALGRSPCVGTLRIDRIFLLWA